MQAPAAFLRLVAQFVLNTDDDALIDAMPSRAGAVWESWSRIGTSADRQTELLALARAPAPTIHSLANSVAAKLTDLSAEHRTRVVTGLSLIPRLIRRWLRRSDDPRGVTIASVQVPFSGRDLLPLLPVRLPRFHAGDRPLPGVERELVELLGVGHQGETWLGRDTLMTTAPPMVLHFCLDVEASARLRGHLADGLLDLLRNGRMSGVVPLRHTYLDAAPPCLEYEYVGGGDLATLAYQLHQGKASADTFHHLLHRLAKTIGAFHRLMPPIVHRNLKPSNVLLQPRDHQRVSLRVADFDLGNDDAWDPRVDVLALGDLWCRMLLGEMSKPLPSAPVRQRRLLRQGVALPVVELLQECLDDEAVRRPADAQVLADRIDALLRHPVAPTAPVAATTGTETAASAVPAAPPEEVTHTAVDWFIEGNQWLDRKKYGAAIRAFKKALECGHDEAAVCHQRAAAYIERRDFDRAAADLDRLITLRPDELEGYLLRGEFFLTVGRINEAIADFTSAVQLNSRSARVYIGRGRACLAKGECDLALACFEKALKRDPNAADAVRYRGDAWLLKGDADRAFTEYSLALRMRPDDPKLHHGRGEVCVRQERPDQAIADFTEAIRLDGSFAPAHHSRGRVFLSLEIWSEALEDITQALRHDRCNPAAFRDRAQVRVQLGKQRAALRDFSRAIKLNPRDPRSYLDRGWLRSLLGDHKRAIADYSRALRLDQLCADACAGRARVYLAMGKLKHALRDFTRVLVLQPDSIEGRLERGLAYLDARQYRRARADARKVLQRDPLHPAALALRDEAERAQKTG